MEHKPWFNNTSSKFYIGSPISRSVLAFAGQWIGIEWDAPDRGKHDGSLAGKRYFQCHLASKSGSFIRLPKVNFGHSLVEAIEKRYISGCLVYGCFHQGGETVACVSTQHKRALLRHTRLVANHTHTFLFKVENLSSEN